MRKITVHSRMYVCVCVRAYSLTCLFICLFGIYFSRRLISNSQKSFCQLCLQHIQHWAGGAVRDRFWLCCSVFCVLCRVVLCWVSFLACHSFGCFVVLTAIWNSVLAFYSLLFLLLLLEFIYMCMCMYSLLLSWEWK